MLKARSKAFQETAALLLDFFSLRKRFKKLQQKRRRGQRTVTLKKLGYRQT